MYMTSVRNKRHNSVLTHGVVPVKPDTVNRQNQSYEFYLGEQLKALLGMPLWC